MHRKGRGSEPSLPKGCVKQKDSESPAALVREGIKRCWQSQGPVKPVMHNEYVICRGTKMKTIFKARVSSDRG